MLAAVDHEHLAGHEPRFVAREEHRGAGEVVGVRALPGTACCCASMLEVLATAPSCASLRCR